MNIKEFHFPNEDIEYNPFKILSKCYIINNAIIRLTHPVDTRRNFQIFFDDNQFIRHSRNSLDLIYNNYKEFQQETSVFVKKHIDLEIDYYIDDEWFLLYDDYETCIGHFLVDSFPKCYYYDEILKLNDKVKLSYVVENKTATFIDETLDLCYKNSLFKMAPLKVYKVKKLIVPSPFFLMCCGTNNVEKRVYKITDKLEKSINTSSTILTEKVYISRQDVKKVGWWHQRTLVNEDELINKLRDKGYSIVELMDLNMEEKIKLFKTSKKIVSTSGAQLYNAFWIKENTEFKVISHPQMGPWQNPIVKSIVDNRKAKFQEISNFSELLDYRNHFCNNPWKINNVDELVNLL